MTGKRPSDGDRDEPLADLAADVEERGNRPSGAADEAFVAVDVAVDAADLWADLLAEDSGELVVSAPRETTEDDRDVRTIPKETCHGCPHVGDPPTVHCTHEGTDILSMADVDHFRVADCPMVIDEEDP